MTTKRSAEIGQINPFIEEVFHLTREIETGIENCSHQVRIAEQVFHLVIPNVEVAQVILPALEHLRVSNDIQPDTTITVWDGGSQHVQLPAPPWAAEQTSNTHAAGSLDGETIFYKDTSKAMAYKGTRGHLSLADFSGNRAVFWMADVEHLYPLDGHPLRNIFQWFLEKNGHQIVHAGGVGFPHGGVILTGRSGAGKSTSTAACLDSPLGLAGDENIVLSSSEPIKVFSIYNSTNLDLKSISLLPMLKDKDRKPHEDRIDKSLYYLHQIFPEKLITEYPLKAIVVTQVIGKGETHLSSIPRAAALTALAPTSLFQTPGDPREAFSRMGRIIRQIPCYRLSIGESVDAIPILLADLIANADRRFK